MIKRIVQLFFIVIGLVLGYALIPVLFETVGISRPPFDNPYFGAVLGGSIFAIVTGWLVGYMMSLIRWVEDRFQRMPLPDMIAGIVGLIVGLIVAYLLTPTMVRIPIVGSVVQIFMSVLFGYLGFRVSYAKREELKSFLPGKIGSKEKKTGSRPGEHKILDTSVIIDGRIADIVGTGFLDGVLVIPSFVLEELQHIADSSDVLKRNRGRRGLDILNRIQKEATVKVQIVETDFEDVQEVDSKLVRLAKKMQGKVVTNDFNLNKVCELQGVPVLNINDLANAVKPVVLPGEEIVVQVIKDGKEHGQGVGYLDDGTMIVVEGGRDYIGTHVDVLVTSVLQTSAGRMIFAKPKLLEKAL
ncbi:PIN/TRAM domain-containing protein [Kyrpidia sp.]|uniref:PIN/TRAM domain-containing protein n=1 Tax=Kyrpidia sp. TaxID=2073077 RepID=UPI002589B769|nr:PIN/TRAM domain-containing protein [Kyrpidia sp.]MCL6575372.1 PIN/TRAM domain-containing protein [Kyrpidia sp.]